MSDEQSNDNAPVAAPKLSFTPTPPKVDAEKQEPLNQEVKPTELEVLKERAKIMGIQHSPNIGVDALKAKIKEKQEGKPAEAEIENEDDEDEDQDEPIPLTESAIRRAERKKARQAAASQKNKKETVQQIRDRLKRDCMKLVRCRIYNMNPSKADLKGEIVTVANKYIGTVRKMIPFGEATDNGFHIEQILFDELKSRKFQQLRPKKVRGIDQAPERRMVPEYNLEILPPLTRNELRELAQKQAAAERLGSPE